MEFWYTNLARSVCILAAMIDIFLRLFIARYFSRSLYTLSRPANKRRVTSKCQSSNVAGDQSLN